MVLCRYPPEAGLSAITRRRAWSGRKTAVAAARSGIVNGLERKEAGGSEVRPQGTGAHVQLAAAGVTEEEELHVLDRPSAPLCRRRPPRPGAAARCGSGTTLCPGLLPIRIRQALGELETASSTKTSWIPKGHPSGSMGVWRRSDALPARAIRVVRHRPYTPWESRRRCSRNIQLIQAVGEA